MKVKLIRLDSRERHTALLWRLFAIMAPDINVLTYLLIYLKCAQNVDREPRQKQIGGDATDGCNDNGMIQLSPYHQQSRLQFCHTGHPRAIRICYKLTTLSGVSYARVYEQTHSRQCCNIFIA